MTNCDRGIMPRKKIQLVVQPLKGIDGHKALSYTNLDTG